MSKIKLSETLKLGMRNLASGVCIITAETENRERVAMTASSVTSVSDNPPSLLVCVNKEARLDSAMAETHTFSVNILGENQQSISENCARPCEGDSRFQQGNWTQHDDTGLFYIKDAISIFICEKQEVMSYGTHNIYIGNVTEVKLGEPEANLLVYAKGSYHSL